MMYVDDKEFEELREDLRQATRQLREQHQVITGMKNMLRIAAEYKNDDIGARLDGVQAALGRAAKFEGRQENGRRKR